MPVCGNYLFFELPKKIVLNPKDGEVQPPKGLLRTACGQDHGQNIRSAVPQATDPT